MINLTPDQLTLLAAWQQRKRFSQAAYTVLVEANAQATRARQASERADERWNAAHAEEVHAREAFEAALMRDEAIPRPGAPAPQREASSC